VAKRRGPRESYRLLTPTERAAIAARFRGGALVKEVIAEFGLPHTSACRIQDEAALEAARHRSWKQIQVPLGTEMTARIEFLSAANAL
jgi:hypothetical protein